LYINQKKGKKRKLDSCFVPRRRLSSGILTGGVSGAAQTSSHHPAWVEACTLPMASSSESSSSDSVSSSAEPSELLPSGWEETRLVSE
jgi:hypothetical protein